MEDILIGVMAMVLFTGMILAGMLGTLYCLKCVEHLMDKFKK